MRLLLFGQSTFTICLIWVRILITRKLIMWFKSIFSGGATCPGSRGALQRRNIGSHDFNFWGCRKKKYPQEIKKYKTYNIYNRIQFLADKFALSISSNATNLFGYPYESRELRILSAVGQNVWKGKWNNQVFQARKNTASSTTDLRLLFMVNQCKFLPASEFALPDR